MSDPFVGQISIFPFAYAPYQWAFCQGQIIQASQNQALLALLGDIYGGDGSSTFGLPDLRGRFPIGTGTSPNFGIPYTLADQGGVADVTLSDANLPYHTHDATFTGTGGSAGKPLSVSVAINASTDVGQTPAPTSNAYLGTLTKTSAAPGPTYALYRNGAGAGTMPLGGVSTTVTGGGGGITGGTVSVQPTGGSGSFPVINPYLALNFCIALNGIFPPRN